MDPLATLLVIVPAFALLGVAMQWVFARFRVSAVQLAARHLRPHRHRRGDHPGHLDRGLPAPRVGVRRTPSSRSASLYVPGAGAHHAGRSRSRWRFAVYAVLRYTDLGRALRASAEDAPIAAAFGINQKALAFALSGVCAALAGVAGVCIALIVHARAVADLRVDRRRVRDRDAGRPRPRDRAAGRRHRDRRERIADDGGRPRPRGRRSCRSRSSSSCCWSSPERSDR